MFFIMFQDQKITLKFNFMAAQRPLSVRTYVFSCLQTYRQTENYYKIESDGSRILICPVSPKQLSFRSWFQNPSSPSRPYPLQQNLSNLDRWSVLEHQQKRLICGLMVKVYRLHASLNDAYGYVPRRPCLIYLL